MSPRSTVRVAAVDAYGDALNLYDGYRRLSAPEPDRPWAVYLAGRDHLFRLLCFDLDAKTPGAAEAAATDADTLTGLLLDVGLQPVVCASGPSGGRHVWVGLAEGVNGDAIATLARLTKHLCPTLDVSPLTNAATGCVRPPGAPHRAGGHSTVLTGSLHALTAPTGTTAQIHALTERVASLVDDAEPNRALESHGPLPLDAHSRLYLPGARRELPAVSAAALQMDAAADDASAVMWRVLVGAAAARWRHADVAALVDTAPGLEHIRTVRDGASRRPRSRTEAAEVLRRQWDKAVTFVATSDRQSGDDPTFDARAGAVVTQVLTLQTRADASAGRWGRGGGPADRRVLDVLCLLSLQALNGSVEADTRRLALLAGIGRETARTALLRLAADGWIARSRHADGPHGAHWTITPASDIHNNLDQARSQADPRPVGAGSAERSTLIASLSGRIKSASHDLFSGNRPAFSHHAGNLYARITSDPQDLTEIARVAAAGAASTKHILDRLTSVGVLEHTSRGWRRTNVDRRGAAAVAVGVDGRLAERAERYRVERELWAWWRAEDAWMRAPQRPGSKRRPGHGQLLLVPDEGTHAYGPHPRGADGRLDWREARRILVDERRGIGHRRVPSSKEPRPRQAPALARTA